VAWYFGVFWVLVVNLWVNYVVFGVVVFPELLSVYGVGDCGVKAIGGFVVMW